jgi:hypothetical protein
MVYNELLSALLGYLPRIANYDDFVLFLNFEFIYKPSIVGAVLAEVFLVDLCKIYRN